MNLRKDEYEEPRCPLESPNKPVMIPAGRVLDKFDEYMSRKDYESAEKLLTYWLNEAELGHDENGMLTVLNEQMGFYRKTASPEKGLAAIEKALEVVRRPGLEDTVSMATTYINAATAYKAFDRAAEALPLYRNARQIYESRLDAGDERLAGLYNNMALTLAELEAYEEAKVLYFKAIEILTAIDDSEADRAITYCNLADLAAAELGLEESNEQVGEYLDRAQELLDSECLPRDSYYAYVCEKCAPTFGYYGYYFAEKELMKRAEDIYERS